MNTEGLIQIAGLCISGLVLLQVIFLSFSSLRAGVYKRRQWQTELSVLEKQISLHALNLDLAKNKSKGAWEGYRKFTISKKEHEKKSGICSFYLKPHDGMSIPSFEPGQYLFFKLNLSTEKKPILRCYSLSDSPLNKDCYRVSIKKALPPGDNSNLPSGISSSYFHDNLQEGDIVDVRAPSGKFYIDLLSHKPVVLIGGGVGITPVLSMLNALCDINSQREIWFFFGIRNGDEHIMESHFKAIEDKFDNIHINICYSRPTEQDKKEKKYHHASRVNIDLLKQLLPSNNYEFYFCGPPQMMDSLETDLKTWGVPKSSVNFERFGSPSKKIVETLDKSIPINFSRSQKTLNWDGAQSLLDLAEDNNIVIDSSCKRGMCGLCQTSIKSGSVFYDEIPEYLPELEEGLCLPCVAKTKDKLELDA
ncbi:MAG: 2Fe-2S iron-sulfur cluster-binding protein [Methylococcaceae bacterium]